MGSSHLKVVEERPVEVAAHVVAVVDQFFNLRRPQPRLITSIQVIVPGKVH